MLKPEIQTLLQNESIDTAAVLPFSACRVYQAHKLASFGLDEETARSVLVVLIPYYIGEFPDSPISLYAVGRDYHVYFRSFFSSMCESLHNRFPQYKFGGSADNSPIDERHAALTAGLGILGDNGLIIHPTYGTYVFIGEILSDMPAEDWYTDPGDVKTYAVTSCEHCGACRRACPMHGNNPWGIEDCLSAVNQTKVLNDTQMLAYIRYYSAAWGCDRCQTACPHNKHPQKTPIAFWYESLLPYPTTEDIAAMDDAAFADRAYAWRKRATITRNLAMLEQDRENGGISYTAQESILAVMRQAGDIMCTARDVEHEKNAVEEKEGTANFVTIYDIRVQNLLTDALQKIFPDAAFLAEEDTAHSTIAQNGYVFVIDPIDGTTNFIHHSGTSAISVGLLWNGSPVFGAIYDPYRDEMFHARRGIGAFLNGKAIHTADRPPEKAVYAVGTAPYYKDTLTESSFHMMRALFLSGADIRRSGSAAIDLAAVACGRADGFCELYLSPWDFTAGALLITEAGGFFDTGTDAVLDFTQKSSVIAGSRTTEPVLRQIMQSL